jgi:hypothetical protein
MTCDQGVGFEGAMIVGTIVLQLPVENLLWDIRLVVWLNFHFFCGTAVSCICIMHNIYDLCLEQIGTTAPEAAWSSSCCRRGSLALGSTCFWWQYTELCSMASVRACLHGSPRLFNAVESITLNATVERYCLHGSTKVNEAVDFKMAANELCGKVLL